VPAVTAIEGRGPRTAHTGVKLDVFWRCAQPGDNLVDQWCVAVGSATSPWDDVWEAGAASQVIPRSCTGQAPSSTIGSLLEVAPDLRKGRFSTLSTPPMTTSLRQGLRMTQALRADRSSKSAKTSRPTSGNRLSRTSRVGAP
jgi:hypothetical protein